MSDALVLGTRGSDLALRQARMVADALGGVAAGVRLEVIETRGDQVLDLPLTSVEDKGVFTRELEVALADGRIDVAVHSLKDLPTTLPPGLALGAVPQRADVGDVLLVRPEALAASGPLPLRAGARVGTSSPRRQALLHALLPGCEAPALFRGNVPTRVAKCVRGEVDAVVLARAGLSRLRLDPTPLVAFDLAPDDWLPAPAQGALGLEVREGDRRVLDRLAPIHDAMLAACVEAERALLARLEAGCHAALGAWARPADGGGLRLTAGALGEDGRWRRVEVTGGAAEVAARAQAALDEASPAVGVRDGWWRPAERWW